MTDKSKHFSKYSIVNNKEINNIKFERNLILET